MTKALLPILARPLLGMLLAAAAMPAQAQLAPASAIGLSKTEAILGGAPSRLAMIMAGQAQGIAPAARAPYAQPAPSAAPAVFRHAPFVINPATPALGSMHAGPIPADRPDVFNSVALQVGHTPLDARWAQVAGRGVGGASGAFAASLRGEGERERIDAVNRYVNRHVSFVDDRRRFGVADRWSAAAETLASGRGDCEDYAIAKMAMLRRAGFADRDLYLVVLKDLVRRADHAVLVVRSEGRFLVLDNGTDQLIDSDEIRDYRPILTFTAGRAFTHGYRRDAVTPPVTYAMAETPATAARPLMTLASATMPQSMPMSMFARPSAQ